MIDLISAAAAAAALAPATPMEPTPTSKWVSHWADASCWLIRSADVPAGSTLAIRRTPGNETLQIMIVDPSWKKSPAAGGAPIEFILEPGSEPLSGETWFAPNDRFLPKSAFNRARLSFSTPDRAADARLAAATSVSVRAGGAELARSNLPAMQKAVNALHDCEADALRAWGLPPAPPVGLRSGPHPVEGGRPVLGPADYPPVLAVEGVGGTSVLQLAIDAAGKVTKCVILETSGNAILDNLSCSLFQKRGRFHPAIDAGGNAVAADYVTTASWSVASP